jgi:hypothetical protein
MEEALDRVVSQPTEAGLAEERMLGADLVREMGGAKRTGRRCQADCARARGRSQLAGELVGSGAVSLWAVSRFTQTIAGIAAAAAQEWEAAEEHFQIALQQAESFPNRLEQAEIRRFHAMMLIDRAAPGDREEAQTLVSEALEIYTQVGMPRHIEMTHALLD